MGEASDEDGAGGPRTWSGGIGGGGIIVEGYTLSALDSGIYAEQSRAGYTLSALDSGKAGRRVASSTYY